MWTRADRWSRPCIFIRLLHELPSLCSRREQILADAQEGGRFHDRPTQRAATLTRWERERERWRAAGHGRVLVPQYPFPGLSIGSSPVAASSVGARVEINTQYSMIVGGRAVRRCWTERGGAGSMHRQSTSDNAEELLGGGGGWGGERRIVQARTKSALNCCTHHHSGSFSEIAQTHAL